MEHFFCFTSFSSLKLYINGPQNKYNASSTHFSLLPGPEHMCARYPLLIGWQLSHHLVSGESTLHHVALFEARWRIFPPIAQSCAALFWYLLAILASSLGWLVGNNSFLLFYSPTPPPPPPFSLRAQYEFWSFETGLILHNQKYSRMAEKKRVTTAFPIVSTIIFCLDFLTGSLG